MNDWDTSSVKNNTNIAGSIEEVERFNTWWSNNVATAINYSDNRYRVFLIVVEFQGADSGIKVVSGGSDITSQYFSNFWNYQVYTFPHEHSCNYWGEKSRGNHNYLSDAKSEARWLRNELSGNYGRYVDNPIFLIHPYCDCQSLFSELVRNPYAIREKLSSTSNPDKYITPLDVVKVEKRTAGIDYDHVGIYLGDNYVCHIAGTPSDKRGVRIHSWSTFLEGARENPVRYHPIIPFKHHEKISKQIAWAAMNEYREGQYQVLKKNCEHFANMVVFGFEHSHQGHSHQEFLKNHMRNSINVFFPFFPVPLEGSGIESEEEKKVKLVDEINRTNSQLGESTSGWYSNIENKIEIPPKRCSVM